MERVTVDVGSVADVPADHGLAVIVEGRPVAIFRVGREVVAYQGTCLHRGGPLAEGVCRDGVLTCPAHWWRYDLLTGSRIDEPAVQLPRYPVTLRDGRVLVTVPVAAEPEGWRDRLLRLAHERAAAEEAGR
ncbi:MAG: Rieske (2Fe-2S) protein [Actinomycetota bacterium]